MRALGALLVSLALLAGCATVDPREDARIEAEVKARLVAHGVTGVRRVVNTLDVRPAAR